MNIDITTHIGKLVAADYRTAAIFKKFGIDFCCQGNRTIGEACASANVNQETVIAELTANSEPTTEHNPDAMNAWPAELLITYIKTLHHSYIREKTPPLRAYLDKICSVHGTKHPELHTIRKEFFDSTDELLHHIEEEEKMVFPQIQAVSENNLPNETLRQEISTMMEEHSVEGERFRKIRMLSNNYIAPQDACNTYRVTYSLLHEFEDDLHRHIHLENNLLFSETLKKLAN